MSLDAQKASAAAMAVAMAEPGMLIGLGTGSTASHAIRLLGEKFQAGFAFTGVPTSTASAALARSYGIPLIESPDGTPIDLTIDGADEIGVADLSLIKGMGGALLWEKIVASMTRHLVIIADETKLVPRLSGKVAVPVEIVPFGWRSTSIRLQAQGFAPVLRANADGTPFRTDSGNFIVHCRIDDLSDPASVERALSMIIGVVETGLFIGMAKTAFVAQGNGVRRIGAAALD